MISLTKIYLILPKRFRFLIILVLIMSSGGALLETIGLGMIVGLLVLITNGNYESLSSLPFFDIFKPSFDGISSFINLEATVLALLLILLFFLLRAIYLILMYLYQAKVIYSVRRWITNRLLYQYMNLSWQDFHERGSSALIRNLAVETRILTERSIYPLVTVINEFFVSILLFSLLLWSMPLVTLSVFLFLLIVCLCFFILIRKRVEQWGSNRQKQEEKLIHTASDVFRGLKELKLSSNSNSFLDYFTKITRELSSFESKQIALVPVPRVLLETIACLALVIVGGILFSLSLEASIFTIGLFGGAAVRILPSMNKILKALQHLRYSGSSSSLILSDLERVNVPPKGKELEFSRCLHLNGISFFQPDGSITLDKVNFVVPKNSLVAITGPSGSGKSTLMGLMMGLIEPNEGEILIDGVPLMSGQHSWWQKCSYVPQDAFIFDGSILENVSFSRGISEPNCGRAMNAIQQAGLSPLMERLDGNLDTQLGTGGLDLSGGEKQRLSFARALYSDREVIFLDEPNSALDDRNSQLLGAAISNLRGRKTIIVISHKLNFIDDYDLILNLS